MTDDIFLTLSLLLSAALVARLLASLLPVPEIQYLAYLHNAEDQLRGEAATLPFFSNGQYRNPMVSALDVVDVPLDSLGAQLLFTLGVSLILFYGGLSLSLPVLRKVWIGLGLLVVPGVVLTAAVVSVRCAGRLFGRASRVRRGGKSTGKPGPTSWKMRSGRGRFLRR